MIQYCFQDRVGKPTQGRFLAVVDPSCKLIAIHMNAGLLKVVSLELDTAGPLKAFNMRYTVCGSVREH